jgi:hypothetical protein
MHPFFLFHFPSFSTVYYTCVEQPTPAHRSAGQTAVAGNKATCGWLVFRFSYQHCPEWDTFGTLRNWRLGSPTKTKRHYTKAANAVQDIGSPVVGPTRRVCAAAHHPGLRAHAMSCHATLWPDRPLAGGKVTKMQRSSTETLAVAPCVCYACGSTGLASQMSSTIRLCFARSSSVLC